MNDKSQNPVPEPQISNEPDGFVKITIGNVKGWVSSYHLIEPKVNQLKRAWLKSNRPNSDI
jgi:hypothetical protein